VAPALVTLLVLSWAGLVLVTGFGYASSWGYVEAARHVRLAIPAFIFGTLAHAMTMFYFIGTGKVVREAAQGAGLDGSWVAETREFKRITFGWATYTLGAIVLVPILGGAVDTGVLPVWVHGILGVITVAMAGWASSLEIICISRNLSLLDRLERTLGDRQAAGAAAAAEPAP
jgi:hypothetical protein